MSDITFFSKDEGQTYALAKLDLPDGDTSHRQALGLAQGLYALPEKTLLLSLARR